jgi:hypothetical protein
MGFARFQSSGNLCRPPDILFHDTIERPRYAGHSTQQRRATFAGRIALVSRLLRI